MGALDFVLGFGKVLKTSIEASTGAVLSQVASSVGSLHPKDTDENIGEVADKQDTYGAGVTFFRPLPAEKKAGKTFDCDTVFIKTSDGLVPIAHRDLRLDKAFPNGPKEGSGGLRGYGGGFITLDLTAGNSGSQKANILVMYCPYEFDGSGVPAKAHAIILDPTAGNESISITHGEGYQLALTKNDGLLAVLDALTFMRAKPGEFLLQAPKIMLKGNVYVGAQAEVGIPLLAGPASPPCPSFFVSPA